MTGEVAAFFGSSADEKFMKAIFDELIRARTKFPICQDTMSTILALVEEVGELSEAYLDAYVLKSHKKGKTEEDIQKEAIQVAVMAIRVALDCERR